MRLWFRGRPRNVTPIGMVAPPYLSSVSPTNATCLRRSLLSLGSQLERMRLRRNIHVAVAASVLVVGGCGGTVADKPVAVDRGGLDKRVTVDRSPDTSPKMVTTTTFSPIKGAQAARAAIDLAVTYGYAAAAQYAKGVRDGHFYSGRVARTYPDRSGSDPQGMPTPMTGSIASVMACIRAHESGNPSESSHPSSGSGSYQYVPQTWRTWSARAGHGSYAYAYLAPAWVQDAVTAYTLTHGGAGNWSNRFGFDPCTAGLPGGG